MPQRRYNSSCHFSVRAGKGGSAPSPRRLLAREEGGGGVLNARQSGGAHGGLGVPNNNVILIQER